MTPFSRRAALGLLLAGAIAPRARAQEISAGSLRIAAPWTRAAGAGATGAGFMAIRNTGAEPDRLVAARTTAARVVELHTHIREGDVMRMRPVAAIELPAGREVRLQPGGLHLMLIGLAAPLRQGERVPLTLVFERAGEAQVELAVQAAGARGHGGGHGH
ncbi:copper chaperone PCu(A)C [Falsiroseomonas oryzae]|uniref:copper chaperone PCu(A)C n=1 Tax=Falsiroseomonas oryzae TaxID=2766473 RepID=UPI0022EAC2D7|nr:copper chaperone PCu(A)C [Roseomonas sp. MO-31]